MDQIIAGAQSGLRVLSDGTVRLMVDVEPKDRVAAMTMFGAPGQPIALAPLKIGYAAAGSKREESGPLCREAQSLCMSPRFHEFVASRGFAATPAAAREYVLERCAVESRKGLDASPEAAGAFAVVRREFLAWQRANPIPA